MPAMPAAVDPTDTPGALGAWDVIVVHRRGAPPLRFMGREVCRAEDVGVWVRFWQVRSGGFVLAHALEQGQFADRYASTDAAMAALEAFCARIDTAGEPADLPPRLALADLLEEVARLTGWRRRFRLVAGRALDLFDLWVRQEMQGMKDHHD